MLILDIESSGTNPSKHSVISIGALEFENPSNRFYGECRVWDGAHISKESLKINGFTEEQLLNASKQSEAELAQKFYEWSRTVNERTIAGQNPSFDRDFLAAAFDRANINNDFAHRTIDTHSLCYFHMVSRGIAPPIDEKHKHSSLNLDAVLNYCGIPDEPEPHNALTGAFCHAEVISRLLFKKNLLEEFAKFSVTF